jgi:hypothetical protein
MFETLGVFPIRDHYYEPLFSSRHIRAPLDRDRVLPGIAMHTDQQLALIRQFHYGDELLRLPLEKGPDGTFYYNNGSFASGGRRDAVLDDPAFQAAAVHRGRERNVDVDRARGNGHEQPRGC